MGRVVASRIQTANAILQSFFSKSDLLEQRLMEHSEILRQSEKTETNPLLDANFLRGLMVPWLPHQKPRHGVKNLDNEKS